MNSSGNILEIKKKISFIKDLRRDQFLATTSDLLTLIIDLNEFDHKNLAEIGADISLVQGILDNQDFQNSILTIFLEEKKIEKSADVKVLNEIERKNKLENCAFEEKKIVRAGLLLGFLLINKTKNHLKKSDLLVLKKNISRSVRKISAKGNGITISNICFKLWNIMKDKRYSVKYQFPRGHHDYYLFIGHLIECSQIVQTLLLTIGILPTFELCFKKATNEMARKREVSISNIMKDIFSNFFLFNNGLRTLFLNCSNKDLIVFLESTIGKNERNLLYFIEKICSGFGSKLDRNSANDIEEKISRAPIIKKELLDYGFKHFGAFKNESIYQDTTEWSNKVFIISIKTISLVEILANAKNEQWKIKAAAREFFEWIGEVHSVLNKYNLDDDFSNISRYLVEENTSVEWKSSFMTAVESPYDKIKEKGEEKKLMDKLSRTIISMINTEGGKILVGVIEKPEKIKRELVRDNVAKVNGVTFYNITQELESKGTTIDEVIRKIQDIIASITDRSVHDFSNLWRIVPICLKTENHNYETKTVTIYQIIISKAPFYLFSTEERNGTLWLSLLKRADRRTISVDPRNFISKTSTDLFKADRKEYITTNEVSSKNVERISTKNRSHSSISTYIHQNLEADALSAS